MSHGSSMVIVVIQAGRRRSMSFLKAANRKLTQKSA
jgi:hypothetical protein